jgi:hypothetical protein
MSRLVCMDLSPGRVVAIRGVRHRIISPEVKHAVPMLTLKPEAGSDQPLKISRSELAALVVLEEAELVDELEDPESDATREVTNLSFIPLHRVIDWHGKVFLLRRMMPWAGSSPKSAEFRAAFTEAETALREYHESIGLVDCKRWSHWTVYHDLMRWRAFKYSFGAIQRKGVEYCQWQPRNGLYDEARKLGQEIWRKNPHYTIAEVHDQANKQLKQSKAEMEELSNG